jgi:hypothetical protein
MLFLIAIAYVIVQQITSSLTSHWRVTDERAGVTAVYTATVRNAWHLYQQHVLVLQWTALL